jgi:hypothetical protein
MIDAALRALDWRLGRVYFLAFLNPFRGQPDPALTARLASPASVSEPAIELDRLSRPAGDAQVVASGVEDPEVGQAPWAIPKILFQRPSCGHDPVALSSDVIYLEH